MQTIWSRIAQTRGTCCCPQCIQSAPGVSRRATASATRSAPKFVTSSTLWYSGIFAAAATFDAGAKKQRREQWDKAIEGVKEELGQPTETARHELQEKQEDVQTAPIVPKLGLEALVEAADVFQEVEPHRRKPKWPTNTGPPLRIHRVPPESIYATDVRKGQAELRRWSLKKLETMMLSIDILQLKIFRALLRDQDQTWRDAASAAVPVQYRDRMFLSDEELHAALVSKSEDLTRLWKTNPLLTDWFRADTDVALSDYSQDDQGSFHDTARELSRCLQGLFRQHTSQALSTPSLLAKVAYNLSLTSAPPNVHTYNTLLLGFSKAQQPALTYSLIRSLRETHVRPNEITNTAILNHYTAQDDAKGFVRWMELMRGKNGGLALARPDIFINEAGVGRLRYKEGFSEEDDRKKVVQLPYPTPNVFNAVIKGVLKFSGFDIALGICEGMGREGWGLCMSGLTPLLMDCADRGDWTSGLAVWRQIQALKLKSTKRNGRVRMTEHIGLGTYAAMLRLCSACDQQGPFQDIWRRAMETHKQKTGELKSMIEAQNERATNRGVLQSAAECGNNAALVKEEASATAAELGMLVNEQDDSSGSVEDEWLEPPSQQIDIQRSTAAAGRSLRELQTTKEDKQNDMPDAAVPSAQSKTQDRAEPASKRSGVAHIRLNLKSQPALHTTPVSWEQLNGSMPASPELDDYELHERPMTMHG